MTIRRMIPLLCLMLGACGFFSRTKSQFYSLETVRTDAAPRAIGGTPIGVEGIELPPGLDRRSIVLRGEGTKLEIRETHQWASPLEDMVTHTLAFDLANRLPEGMVILPGQAKPGAGGMRSIYVTFEDLAAGQDGVFVLDARWSIDERKGHERITVNMTSKDSAAVVAAMSQALATFADRIVAAL